MVWVFFCKTQINNLILTVVPLCSCLVTFHVIICHFFLLGHSGSLWVKHRIKDKYDYFYNLESQTGTWVEPDDFVHDSTQLTKEDIQVGYEQSRLSAVRSISINQHYLPVCCPFLTALFNYVSNLDGCKQGDGRI